MSDNPQTPPENSDALQWGDEELDQMSVFTPARIAAIMAKLAQRNPELAALINARVVDGEGDDVTG